MKIKISGISYSLSPRLASKHQWLDFVYKEIQSCLDRDADVILFPELFLLGLCEYYPGDFKQQLTQLAKETETTILPKISTMMRDRDTLLCFGSGPRLEGDELRNSSPIYLNGNWHFQDKIHLTPWETDFSPGDTVHLFQFRGLTTAVLICFDVEQPSLSYVLKNKGVDFLLVPSATADRNGNQRVIRCASARSIELGAAVITVPLTGKSSCDLVDFSEGRQAFFLPAQAASSHDQEQDSAYMTEDSLIKDYDLDLEMMKKLKMRNEETKPYFKREVEVKVTQKL